MIFLASSSILFCSGALGELVYNLGDMRERNFARLTRMSVHPLVHNERRLMDSRAQIDVSVIVPVGERQSDLSALYADTRPDWQSIGVSFEFIFVIDGPFPEYLAAVERLAAACERITIVS